MSADEFIGLLNTTIMSQKLDSEHVVVKVTYLQRYKSKGITYKLSCTAVLVGHQR